MWQGISFSANVLASVRHSHTRKGTKKVRAKPEFGRGLCDFLHSMALL